MRSRTQAASDYATKILNAPPVKPTPPQQPLTDADFKKFILYVESPEDRSPLSNEALRELSKSPSMKIETLIQYVTSLPNVPSWLDKVPCLVLKEEKKALKGQECIKYIADFQTKGPDVTVSFKKKHTGHKKVLWDE